MKKSFFLQYFLYKFKSLRGFLAASIALSIAGMPILVTIVKIAADMAVREAQQNPGGSGYGSEAYELLFGTVVLGTFLLPLIFAALIVITAIVPIVNFKYYNNRACVDTIGSLPLNYNERFFGDFLSGLLACVAPFVVCIPYIMIMANGISAAKLEEFERFFDIFSQNAAVYAIILLSTYTFSSLIASCCGRVGSSVFYSLFGMLFVPLIVMLGSRLVFLNTLGIDRGSASLGAFGVIAPFGVTFDFIKLWFEMGNTFFSSSSDLKMLSSMDYVVMLILTVVYAVGAYFLGKYRKSERVGRDFVYESAYTVMSVMFAGIISGLVITAIFDPDYSESIVPAVVTAVLGIIACIALELTHTRDVKKLSKALIKYAVVAAASVGLFAVVKVTEGFGLSELVPGLNEVSRIEVRGKHLFSFNNEPFVYDDKDAVEEIISEHKNLISDRSKIETGDEIIINYKLKNGLEIKRQYSAVKGGDVIKTLSGKIGALPTSNSNAYGVLSLTDYSDLVFEVHTDEEESGIDMTNGLARYYIKASKTEEFKQILLKDIKEYYIDDIDHRGTSTFVIAYYKRNGTEYSDLYRIPEQYEASRKFIFDPDNRETETTNNSNQEQTKTYQATFISSLGYIFFDFTSEDENAKELISMLVIEGTEGVSDKIRISDGTLSYFVKKSDEKRAWELFMKMARERLTELEQ